MTMEAGGEDRSHSDHQTPVEGRMVDLVGHLLPEDRVRIWREQAGPHGEHDINSHETIIAKSYGGHLEFRWGSDPDINPLVGKTIERLELLYDGDTTWVEHKGEKPKWGGSSLYRAVVSDGSAFYIEKYPPGIEISERRDRQDRSRDKEGNRPA